MSKMNDMMIELSETPIRIKCPDCDGDGFVEYEVPRPHNFNRDVGYIDTETEVCDTCSGDCEVDRTCVECGYPVMRVRVDADGHYVINGFDYDKCEECSL